MSALATWRKASGWIALGLLLATTPSEAATALQPRIEYLEVVKINGTNILLIHFDTEPGYYYELEFTDTLTKGGPGGSWTRLKPAYPKLPSVAHYIEWDYLTSRQRFYRLRAYR